MKKNKNCSEEKILIHHDQQAAEKTSREREKHFSDLSEILSDYNALGLPELTGPEFQNLIRNPKLLVFDKLNEGQPLQFNGMQVSKAKALDLVSMPDGFDQLAELIESFKTHRPGWDALLNNTNLVKGELTVKECVLNADAEAAKVYISTDKEKGLYSFLETVIEAAKEYLGVSQFHDLGALITSTISRDAVDGKSTGYKIIAAKVRGFGEPPRGI